MDISSQAAARREMVRQQLQQRGVVDRHVLEAIQRVPRHRFVTPGCEALAYDDRALPIDCGQTISQPLIVGLMTQALDLTGSQRVLEVGTGSGYQAAVLAELAAEVISIERHPELSAAAARVLDELGYANVSLVVGDGWLGWPPKAPYDRIIVTAAAEKCPPALLEQLADRGILVVPVGPDDAQELMRFERHGDRIESTWLTSCRFVPLLHGTGDQPAS
jgi:protein-L-isoaspartate(D-aspartate) O-methyltransferase